MPTAIGETKARAPLIKASATPTNWMLGRFNFICFNQKTVTAEMRGEPWGQ
ncbi:hypothetical protein QJS04_geneDACA022805 [Acorus gramineus]|uniref:Uncharacterized protein n=1 Tax=Acorus gramineus TaxID=55184 RepID=A0AAV9B149_ACOGR|nr:hypothetical protein QJS04_geneDACA022805 [Acorus gramineus]